MGFSQALLPEFDLEMTGTRTALERVPDDKLGWRPHPKSNTMAWLAGFIAVLPGWTITTLERDSLDLHRGQLTVYFRLTGVPVPALYGPTADEAGGW